MADTLFTPELAGLWVGLAISLLVFSTILGDHWGARLGQHLLVGASLGYAGAVVWLALRESILVKQLVADPRGYWWHWIAVALLVLLIAVTKPSKDLVGGLFMRDRKGRIVLVLTPTRKRRRRR